MMESYDLVVLGAGPGGLSAAIQGARKGARVSLVDPGPLGGTCLNRGCIPARAFGTTARLMAQLRKAETLGLRIEGKVRADLSLVLERKERILRRLRGGLATLLTGSKVAVLQGEGILQGPHEVEVRRENKSSFGLQAKSIVLATGSRPGAIPGCPVDGKHVVTSDEILELSEIPPSLIVVGAGVVGCEFASYFADLGSSVTLVEAADRILPTEDPAITEAFHQSLEQRGVTIRTKSSFKSIPPDSLVLLAAGRAPQLPQGAEALGLHIEKGAGLPVDETLRTRIPSIFGIGDLLGEYQLACTASYEGAVAAENALGGSRRVEYTAIPDAIFTEPEIATVGLNTREAEEEGRSVRVSRLTFTGFARAQTLEETEGFVQVVAERESGKILGVQIFGARATDLVGEAALAIRHGLTLKDLTDTLHGHPTMSESLWEAAAMAMGQSIYYATRDL